MNSIDWQIIYYNSHDLLELTYKYINKVKKVMNKLGPIKIASLSKTKQLTKPWLSKGLLTSIKIKQKSTNQFF